MLLPSCCAMYVTSGCVGQDRGVQRRAATYRQLSDHHGLAGQQQTHPLGGAAQQQRVSNRWSASQCL